MESNDEEVYFCKICEEEMLTSPKTDLGKINTIENLDLNPKSPAINPLWYLLERNRDGALGTKCYLCDEKNHTRCDGIDSKIYLAKAGYVKKTCLLFKNSLMMNLLHQ